MQTHHLLLFKVSLFVCVCVCVNCCYDYLIRCIYIYRGLLWRRLQAGSVEEEKRDLREESQRRSVENEVENEQEMRRKPRV